MADLTPANPAPLADTVRDQDKIMLILAYFGIFALIPLLTVKDSAYVKWHAKQGIVLTGAVVAAEIAFTIVFGIIAAIIHPLAFLIGCFAPLISLGFMVVAIYCMVKAVGGERWRIPVVADLADKF
jgi:uncharacterized membrane protein